MSTYRAYQESADRSLTRLVSADLPLPTATSDVTRLLQLRHVCLGVLVERLEHIARASGLEASRARLLTKVSSDPVSALGHALRGMAPETPADFSIVELTDRSGAATTQVIDEYREVARNLILANHNLTHAAEQPWLINRMDAWPIVTDLATNTEAMLILDERLEQAGIFPRPTQDDLREAVTDRFITSQAARIARWHSTTDTVDLATAAEVPQAMTGPVVLISQAADLAPAQRRLAGYLRHLPVSDNFSGQDVTIDSATLGVITKNQKHLCDALAVTARNARSPSSSQAFADGSDLLGDVITQLRTHRLMDVGNRGLNQRALWQQTEITRWLKRNPVPVLEGRQALSLAEATHQTLATLGKAARFELTRPAGTLRSVRDDRESRISPLGHKHPLVRSLRALTAAEPPFRSPGAAWVGPRHSEALRRTLDATPPATGHTPSPYPRRAQSPRLSGGPER